MTSDICIICSQDKLDDGLIVCSDCNKPEETSFQFREGAKYVLVELAALYSGLTETDIWAKFFREDEER